MRTLLSNVLLISASVPLLGYGGTRRIEGALWGLALLALWLLVRYGVGSGMLLLLMMIPVSLVLAGLYLAERFTRERPSGPGVRWICLALGLALLLVSYRMNSDT